MTPKLSVNRAADTLCLRVPPCASRSGARLVFALEAHDGTDMISRGTHENFVIHRAKLDARVDAKRYRA